MSVFWQYFHEIESQVYTSSHVFSAYSSTIDPEFKRRDKISVHGDHSGDVGCPHGIVEPLWIKSPLWDDLEVHRSLRRCAIFLHCWPTGYIFFRPRFVILSACFNFFFWNGHFSLRNSKFGSVSNWISLSKLNFSTLIKTSINFAVILQFGSWI